MTASIGSKNQLNIISGTFKITKITDTEKTSLSTIVFPANMLLTDSTGALYMTDGTTSVANLKPIPAIYDKNGNEITSTYLTKQLASSTYQAKEAGKGLSTNDFTAAYKSKLDGIEEKANNYTLPAATASKIGGVSIPSTETHLKVSTSGALTVDVSDKLNTTDTAAAASKLATSRTISISGDVSGSTTFDGSADKAIAVTLASSGATAGTYGTNSATAPGYSGKIVIPTFTVDAKGRITSVSNTTITLPAEQTSVAGNAGTATKLATARTIAISGAVTGTATSFDGSTNITIATTSVDGTKVTGIVPKASQDGQGNTISTTYAKKADVYTKDEVDGKVAGIYHYCGSVASKDKLPTTGVTTGDVYNVGDSLEGKNYAAVIDSEGNISWDDIGGVSDLSAYYTKTQSDAAYLGKTATATAATKLATARTISLSGDATGSTAFDGTGNSSITVALAGSGVTAGTYGPATNVTGTHGGTVSVPAVTVDAKGRVTSAASRTITFPAAQTSVTGNAGTATKLATSRTIALSGAVTGTATGFDGSANITIPTTSVDGSKVTGTVNQAAKISIGKGVTNQARSVPFQEYNVDSANGVFQANYDTDFTYNPATKEVVVGTVNSANVVKSLSISGKTITVTKGDSSTETISLPADQTSISGNAATASKLQTARTIAISGDASGSASFDGSANISIAATLADTGVTADTYGPAANVSSSFGGSFTVPAVTVDSKGRITAAAARTITLPAAPTSVSGNAGTATKLATARTISLSGDVSGSASFDGSAAAAISATLASSGVTAGTYGPAANATATHGGTITVPAVTVDAKGRVTGAASRTITMPAAQTSVSGNAGTATKLQTARTIGISGAVTGTATSFDGSANITIAATSVDGTKVTGIVPKASQDGQGNTISTTYAKKADVYTKDEVDGKVSGAYHFKGTVTAYANLPTEDVSEGDVYNVGSSLDGDNYAAHFDDSGNLVWDKLGGSVDLSAYLTKTAASTTYLGISANAASASKLATARTIALSGDVTGSTSFNGAANATISATLANSGATAGTYGESTAKTAAYSGTISIPKVTVDAKGRVTSITNTTVTLPAVQTSVTGNAGTATKLSTARTISATGDATGSASFDGSANASMTLALAASGVTAGTYGPAANATATHGGTITVPAVTVDAKGRVTGAASRTITMPAAQTSVTGNAGTATKLATARTISLSGDATGSASFDGSANTAITATLASSGVTAGTYGESANKTAGFSGTISVPKVTVDAKGRVTSASNTVVTLPATPTTISGNAGSATKLQTSRTIAISGGVTGSATAFDGSANISIPVSSVAEGYLTWGGNNKSGYFGPLDAALVSQLGANRLAFINGNAITVEYSNDSGSTWSDYGATAAQKSALFSTSNAFAIGKQTSKATVADQLRITINTATGSVYTVLEKFVLLVSTSGASGAWCTIEVATNGAPTTFKTVVNKQGISGWSGYNIINSQIITYGNNSSQNQFIRFTFGITGVNSTYSSVLNIQSIYGYGGVGWNTPSTMAKTGHLYAFDYAQNATFPAAVTASSFNGTASSASTVGYTVGTDNVARTIPFNDSSYSSNSAFKACYDTAFTYNPSSDTLTVGSVNSANVIKALSISGKVITYTKGDGNTGTISLPADQTTISGNAGTASKLQTARTISISGDGSGSTTFDGSANTAITLTLAASGATAGSYGPAANASIAHGGTLSVPQVTVDAKGRVTGIAARTITFPAAPTSVSGNAGTATKLATARTIGISGAVTGTATSFDGSGNITIAATAVDGTKVTGTVPKATADGSGNTISTTYAKKTDVYTKTEVNGLVAGAYHYKGTVATEADLPTTGVVSGDVYNIGSDLSGKNVAAIVASDGTISWDSLSGTVDLSAYQTKTQSDAAYLGKSATAAAATKLATARTIALSGDVSGSASFNGTANASITATLAASGATAGSYGPTANASIAHGGTLSVPQVTVDAKGRVTGIVARTITFPAAPTSVSGNAGTATKLATARTISATGDATGSASFDGSANASMSLTLAASGVTAGSYGTSAATTPAFGGSFNVPYITVDAKGRVTSAKSVAVTLPAASVDAVTDAEVETMATNAWSADDYVATSTVSWNDSSYTAWKNSYNLNGTASID